MGRGSQQLASRGVRRGIEALGGVYVDVQRAPGHPARPAVAATPETDFRGSGERRVAHITGVAGSAACTDTNIP